MRFCKFIVFLLFFICAKNNAQIYRTQIFNSQIKTLEIKKQGEKYASNVISLDGSEKLVISFDELSHQSHSYSYKVFFCNADWTISPISSNEYLHGFVGADITDYARSIATTTLYTHYKFELPNEQMKFKISGNYLVLVYEDNNINKPIAQVCFSVYDPKVTIDHNLRFNTDIELNGRYQQLDFDIKLNGVNVQIPQTQLKVLVRQNNRYDNEVYGIQPTYINGSVLNFMNNRNLIFEAGNEFHTIDLSSVFVASRGVDRIRFVQPNYEAFLSAVKVQKPLSYVHEYDANGKFIINSQEAVNDVDVEADYMYVNFSLEAKEPFLDGRVFVGGDFSYNLANAQSMMNYDFTNNVYIYRTFLKQGGYNFQYRFLKKNESKLNVEKIEGSFWQTSNEYSIFVYFRPFGLNYDQLIGVKFFDK